MVTITRGEIIELNVRIETRMTKISFFACFCSSSNSKITILNRYSRQFDPYFVMAKIADFANSKYSLNIPEYGH